MTPEALVSSSQIEAGENLLRVGQKADNFADWSRPFSHQRWQCLNLVLESELRIFREINDLDSVAASEVLFANPL